MLNVLNILVVYQVNTIVCLFGNFLYVKGIDAAQGGVKFLSFANSACHIELNVNRSPKMNVHVSIISNSNT